MNKVIKFVQPSCVPCRVVDGLLNHLGLKVDESHDIAMDNAAFELAQKLGVQSTPTIMLLDESGNVLDRVSGANQDAIKALFEKRG
ncbi:thioredoxin family protein [Paenibacillus agilis]|uniref:Thioredoxin family protein n=1 Tax=Paenibacillus agilis TaxID=3020863 RepID=A0A559IEC1_9BACL|nr:thioredoxin family protein [Paenibacillus agilis]TVX86004.1 thioredoxin family protein [Paenibacillus agilis]